VESLYQMSLNIAAGLGLGGNGVSRRMRAMASGTMTMSSWLRPEAAWPLRSSTPMTLNGTLPMRKSLLSA
jgi:hypothetical protein